MHGGFFGVEVFFVISGFLITSLLIDERVAAGSNHLGLFWMRRARRLLPALVVVLLAVSAWTLIAGTGEQSAQLRHDMPWTVFYAANWGQILGAVPYFAHVDPPLLRHLWSLAVEEQWYLLWPFVFVGLSWLGLRARRTACLLAGTALAIFALVFLLRTNDPDRINLLYLSTPTRSAGLLLGAAFAFAWRRWRHRPDRLSPGLLDAAAATALVVLGVCFVVGRVTATVTYPWTMALVSITSAVAVVLTVHPGAVRTRRLLGSGGMAAIGRRSYGIYLWHWPVFVIVGATAGSWPRFIVGSAIALVLSEACYRCVEMPIRRGALGALWARRRSVAVLAAGVAASTVVVLGVTLAQVGPYDVAAGGEVEQFVLAIQTGGESRAVPPPTSDVVATAAATVAESDSVPAALPPATSTLSSSSILASTSITPPTTTSTTSTTLPVLPRSVAIVGDSQAHSLFVNLPRGIDDYFEFSDGAVSGCSVHESGEIVTARRGFHNDFGICRGWARRWADAARGADVALVVLGAWDVFDIRDGDNVIEFGSTEYDRLFSRRLRSGLDALAFAGAHAALLEVPCMRPVDARGAAVPALSERGDDARVAHINMLLRRAAARDPQHVTFIEGPDEWCDDAAIATDVDYRWDGVHVYTKGANLVFEAIARALLAIPIDPR
jgi:peptidoglycan/LPS O-acetylase OafA/YrhL